MEVKSYNNYILQNDMDETYITGTFSKDVFSQGAVVFLDPIGSLDFTL